MVTRSLTTVYNRRFAQAVCLLLTIIHYLRVNNYRLAKISETTQLDIHSYHNSSVGEKASDEEEQRQNKNDSSITRPLMYNCTLESGENMKLPTFPHFLIVGAQKAGTSALYHVLDKHPSIQQSLRFEPHFFDFRGRVPKNVSSVTEQQLCEFRKKYAAYFPKPIETNETMLTFEKTPSYLPLGHIPAAIDRICYWKPKIIIMLRNPVDRAYSQYKMARGRKENYTAFDDVVMDEVESWRKNNLTQAPRFDPAMEATSWLEHNESVFGLPNNLTSKQRNNPHLAKATLFRGLYAQQIKNWLCYFPLGEQLVVVQYERFEANKTVVLNELLDFLGAPRLDMNADTLEKDYSPNRRRKAKSPIPDMPNGTRAYLQRLYRPYNLELVELLGEEWRDIWE